MCCIIAAYCNASVVSGPGFDTGDSHQALLLQCCTVVATLAPHQETEENKTTTALTDAQQLEGKEANSVFRKAAPKVRKEEDKKMTETPNRTESLI